jgi:hypothetical protein
MKTLIAIAIALAVVATSAHAEVIPDFKPATPGVQAAQPPMGDADFVPVGLSVFAPPLACEYLCIAGHSFDYVFQGVGEKAVTAGVSGGLLGLMVSLFQSTCAAAPHGWPIRREGRQHAAAVV